MVLVISKAPILPAYSEPPSTPDPTAASGYLVLGLGLGFGLGDFRFRVQGLGLG